MIPRSILVIKLRHHGDVLLTTPVFNALKRQFPQARIDALVYQESADILADNPNIHTIHALERGGGLKTKLWREIKLIRTLRRANYDTIIHLTELARVATWCRLLRPTRSISMDGPWNPVFKRSFTHLYQPLLGNRRHIVEQNLDALRVLGWPPISTDKKLVLNPGLKALATRDATLREQQLDTNTPYIVIHPGSRWGYKEWTLPGWIALIRRLVEDNWVIVLTGSPNASECGKIKTMVDTVLQSHAGAKLLNRAGQGSLRDLAAWIAGARAVVSVDSLPMHMAAALQVPTVSLFGPSYDREWAPWTASKLSNIVQAGFPCQPCNMKGCGNSEISECLRAISPDQVYQALQPWLLRTDDNTVPLQTQALNVYHVARALP